MSDDAATAIFHSNRYTAQSACEHCQGVIRHETWCITVHRAVYYAYEIVADPSKLTIGDAIILHSLGVAWGAIGVEASARRSRRRSLSRLSFPVSGLQRLKTRNSKLLTCTSKLLVKLFGRTVVDGEVGGRPSAILLRVCEEGREGL